MKSSGRTSTDFYEYYWAHKMQGTKVGHLLSWLWDIFKRPRRDIPDAIVPIWRTTRWTVMQQAAMRAPHRRGGELENVRSMFEEEDNQRRSTFRRPRSNSSGLSAVPRKTGDAPPMPTTPVISTPVTTTSSAMTAKSAAEAVEQIKTANAVLVPAKKRVVNKLAIGEPKLVSSTSNLTDISLPVGEARRKRNNTLFGRGKTTEDVRAPAMPTGKLRKSTSDGGSLGQRARVGPGEEMPRRAPQENELMKGGMI